LFFVLLFCSRLVTVLCGSSAFVEELHKQKCLQTHSLVHACVKVANQIKRRRVRGLLFLRMCALSNSPQLSACLRWVGIQDRDAARLCDLRKEPSMRFAVARVEKEERSCALCNVVLSA
jgi:hypothetical protein